MNDETLIRELLQARARATGAKDAMAAVKAYSRDVVNFDLAPPLAQRGEEATNPGVLQEWFDTWEGPFDFTLHQLVIRVSGDIAFAYGLIHMAGKRTDGSVTDAWPRCTVCLERRKAEWEIVHEHTSFPMRMDGSGKVASDLLP